MASLVFQISQMTLGVACLMLTIVFLIIDRLKHMN